MGQHKLYHAGRYITIKPLTLFHAHMNMAKIVYTTLQIPVYVILSVVVFLPFMHLIYRNYALTLLFYEKLKNQNAH